MRGAEKKRGRFFLEALLFGFFWRGRGELQERCSELEEGSLVGGRITWSPVGLCWRKTPSGMITTGILMFLAVYLSSISLFLMIEYLLVCLGWILEATGWFVER